MRLSIVKNGSSHIFIALLAVCLFVMQAFIGSVQQQINNSHQLEHASYHASHLSHGHGSENADETAHDEMQKMDSLHEHLNPVASHLFILGLFDFHFKNASYFVQPDLNIIYYPPYLIADFPPPIV
ncbi:MAG: hypothetical protein HRU06_02105 [Oceanospirillaceae bacterium]|nr:hypothetical protein [Oceanospirillaceae bacterium]